MRLERLGATVALACLLFGAAAARADGFHCGATAVQLAGWMTSASAEMKEDEAFTTIPDTGLVLSTARKGDLLVRFCAQVDNPSGGRTLLRAVVDGEVAEPDLDPAAIFSWDQFLPQTRCMDFVAPRIGKGEHAIEIQWSNDLGGVSRVSYRTLTVFAPAMAMRVTFEPGAVAE